jgi:ribonuclease BN (tRNA processing enzyme)
MKVRILGSSPHDTKHQQYTSSYIINGTVAIDAGCLGTWGTPEDQQRVRAVFLTHSHVDHVGTLPLFIENVFTPDESCPVVYGHKETVQSLQSSVFNDRIWPDFVRLSTPAVPFLLLETLEPEQPVTVFGLKVTPVLVDHVVPTFGYVIDDGSCSVIFGGDSGPTKRLWEIACETKNLRAVFLEAGFPNSMRWLAGTSRHLTPDLFAKEAAKIPEGTQIVAVHLKPRYRNEIAEELKSLRVPSLAIGECETEYEF